MRRTTQAESDLAGKARSYRAYMAGVRPHWRAKVWRAYARRLDAAGLARSGMNRRRRELLHDALFEVEDELESRNGGQPDEPNVKAMNVARNRVLDDLGWNG